VISTQSPPPLSLSLVDSSLNCRHKLIVASDGWHGTCERSACRWPPIAITSLSSNRNRRHLIIVIRSSSLSSTTSTFIIIVVVVVVVITAVMFHFPSSLLPSPSSLSWRRCRRCRRRHRHRRSSSSCLLCSLASAVNPRNLTKASQGGITHGMEMGRLPLDLP
jgi:hypothetical protein